MIVTKEIKVLGMHCSSCSATIEESLAPLEGVHSVKANYPKSRASIRFDDEKIGLEAMAEICKEKGFTFQLANETNQSAILKLAFSLLALAVLLSLLLLAREFGHRLKLPEINSVTNYGMVFLVGLLTGLHCVGMCGSFVIGYTAKDAEHGRSVYRSHILYGAGKTISYALFGALFGLLGSLFRITPFFSRLSILLAGLFLIIYGLNLLNLFAPLKAIRIKLPATLSGITAKMRWKTRSPFLVGFLSGMILGCGPLQAMYVMAAGLGNPLTGAIALAIFGLGTLPALTGFGFLARILSNSMTSRIIHATGIVLIVMGIMMFQKGLTPTPAATGVESVPACCQH